MQIVMSSFEEAAGYGAAKSYTWLALRTISKQFRCLKDAISWQIKATRKRLGEEECLGGKMEGSRLRYVDHHLRQQRALQQLGMMQHNAWRPQRGLPERAVSILRAWLFEHFLHP
ncbi:BEL1-like homeodomain protein 1 [Senna tora]|uniref:BEL1-like homeodomain protein 1 n=1 Tax=Senna tora TaxID=362788 RepID=A0A834SNA5_9FABA|nr:BEL1-like homeodomain protein 1 [Senna tora]